MSGKMDSIGRWVSILYRYGQTYLDIQLEPYAISSGQFMFLAALFAQDGVTQDALTSRLKIDKGTTARAITKLEEAGYVTREQDFKNRRANVIFLTRRGWELQPIIKRISEAWTEITTAGFSDQERALAFDILERMAANTTRKSYLHLVQT